MAKVFFTREITPESLVRVYEALSIDLPGKVGIKVSTGEAGGNNYLKPKLIEALVKKLNGTIIECNTAYGGKRNTVEDHMKVARDHGFTDIADVDIMDPDNDEFEIPVKNGKHLDVDIVGEHLKRYDSMLNLAHFKGHAMGGFGGVLKNQSIGVASRNGKAYIHSAGKTRSPKFCWIRLPKQEAFLESMAEAAMAVSDYFGKKAEKNEPGYGKNGANGRILYIDVMNNLSVDCDCDSSPEDPCMNDIGIIASVDPVSLDQAAIDLIWNSKDRGRDHFVERVERQKGRYILPYAEEIGLGSREYQLIEV